MEQGAEPKPKRKDKIVTMGMMTVRLGFMLALLLGLGMMFGYAEQSRQTVRALHLAAGLVVITGLWMATIRLAVQGTAKMVLIWSAAGLSAVGALMGLASMMGASLGILHLVVMLTTVSLAEIGVARVRRQA